MELRQKKTDIQRTWLNIGVLQMCITAVFMALTCIATMIIQIPIPLGYAHLGDSVILICTFFFGPAAGALAGGIGSAMADILSGYAVWALPTLLIKTVMPIIAYAFFRQREGKCRVFSFKSIAGAVAALMFMTAGYDETKKGFVQNRKLSIKRAISRYEDFERKGYIEGDILHVGITFSGLGRLAAGKNGYFR